MEAHQLRKLEATEVLEEVGVIVAVQRAGRPTALIQMLAAAANFLITNTLAAVAAGQRPQAGMETHLVERRWVEVVGLELHLQTLTQI